jgi:predicted metalloprotease with PDZ domain
LRVSEVVPGSPAARAGVYIGDAVISAGGVPIATVQDLQRLMLGTEVGRRFPVTVYRQGALVDVVAELTGLADAKPATTAAATCRPKLLPSGLTGASSLSVRKGASRSVELAHA